MAPEVFRIPLPLPNDGLRAVNVYAIRGADGRLTMIDGGWSIAPDRDRLLQMLDRLGHAPADIARFLVTHHHRDHYTLAIALRREVGATVAIGEGERATLEMLVSPDHRPLQRELERMRALGASPVVDRLLAHFSEGAPPAPDDMEWPDQWLLPGVVEAGDRSLDVVPTPGHTRGHVVFHDVKAALLFAGDHVLSTITPSIGLEPSLSGNPLGDFLDSLALVRARPDAMLLPAHGPVMPSAHARVDELLAHHGQRLDATEAAVRAGATTAYQIAHVLTWTRRQRSMDELDAFNQVLAVGETGAHLDALVAQGRLRRTVVDGFIHYLA